MINHVRAYWVLSCLLMNLASGVSAQIQKDTVHRRSGIKQQGEILRYDSKGIQIAVTVGGARKVFEIPMDEIDRVEVKLTQAQEQGNTSYLQRDWRNAIRQFEVALTQEKREWLKEQLWSRLQVCYRRTGRTEQALRTFSNQPTDNITWGNLPLRWIAGPVTPAARAEANRLIQSRSPLHVLVGASYLFTGPQSSEIKNRLVRLETSSKGVLKQLVRCQLWRWNERPGKRELSSWSSSIERLPPEVRGGPKLLLGLAHWQLGDADGAVMLLLWPAFVMKNDPATASAAAMAAADILVRSKRRAEAQKVYEVIIREYPESGYVSLARDRIASLKE